MIMKKTRILMNKSFLVLLLALSITACKTDDADKEPPACDSDEQGFSIEGTNVNFNDDQMHVDLITGGSNGDYYHIYSTVAPFVDFYTYAIHDGDTSTFSENWNTTDGSFMMIDGVAYYTDPNGVTSFTLTTQNGGNAVGDNVRFTFSGSAIGEVGTQEFNGEACLTLDAVIEIPSACSSVAIEYSVNGGPITYVESLVTAEIFVETYYTVNRKVYDIWTDSGDGFYFHSSASASGETSNYITDWQNNVGSTLIIPGLDFTGGTLTFTTVQEASAVGDLVTIEFSGTFNSGTETISGTICTYIDIVHP